MKDKSSADKLGKQEIYQLAVKAHMDNAVTIAELMEWFDITQADIAKLLFISPPSVVKWKKAPELMPMPIRELMTLISLTLSGESSVELREHIISVLPAKAQKKLRKSHVYWSGRRRRGKNAAPEDDKKETDFGVNLE